MFKGIDFYSDTITRPTAAMRQAIANAEVGDEQQDEDPTTRRLEEMAAEKLGHETAIFLPSATMANQIAICYHCEPGNEVISAHQAHILFAEAGAMAAHSGVIAKPIPSFTGVFSGLQLRDAYEYGRGFQSPITRLVVVENTTNMGGGVPWMPEELDEIHETAKELDLRTHLDGSRVFNAAIATKKTAASIAGRFNTATLCLSKGLGCPAGAILAFSKAAYPKIRRLKQMFGGSFRQSGILAAAGIYAFENHLERLGEDHARANELAKAMSGLPYISVENEEPPTNMVYFRWKHSRISAEEFSEMCKKKGIRFSRMGADRFRAVTHLDIRKEDIPAAAKILNSLCSEV